MPKRKKSNSKNASKRYKNNSRKNTTIHLSLISMKDSLNDSIYENYIS